MAPVRVANRTRIAKSYGVFERWLCAHYHAWQAQINRDAA
jgi:hypothetical protein